MKRLDISTGELLEAMIDGKLEDWNKLDFKMYLEENGLDNEESLRLLLEEIDNKIREFHDSFFISEYDKYQHGVGEYPKEVTREFEDYLDSLYHEETGWEQAGKKRYTLDTLYRLMNERGLFFNEAHECAVNKAYEEKNCELLKHFYEEYVLRNVQEFRDHVKGMLGNEENIKECLEMIENQSLKQGEKVKRKDGPAWGAIIALFCHYTVEKPSLLSKDEIENILSEFGNPIKYRSVRNAINDKLIKQEIYEPTDSTKMNNFRRKWLGDTLLYLRKLGYNTKEIEADIAKFRNFK